jgi:hypothetical protein
MVLRQTVFREVERPSIVIDTQKPTPNDADYALVVRCVKRPRASN